MVPALVGLFCVLALPVSAIAAAEPTTQPGSDRSVASLLDLLGPGFNLRQTPHFVIAYDGDAGTLQDFISRLEATYRSVTSFLRVCEVPFHEPEQRLQVIFFVDYQQFHDFAARQGTDSTGMAGFFDRVQNYAVFYDAMSAPRLHDANARIATLEKGLRGRSLAGRARDAAVRELGRLRVARDRIIELINRLVVQHEVAHQVLFNTGVHVFAADNPTWLVEGLACLFEAPPTAHGAGLAVANPYRLLNFREALVGSTDAHAVRSATADDFDRAVAAGRLYSVHDLVVHPELFNASSAMVENVYAETWALTFYLQRRRRDDLAVYMTVIARRPADRSYSPGQEWKLFEATFGPIDEDFQKSWLDFILRLRVTIPRG